MTTKKTEAEVNAALGITNWKESNSKHKLIQKQLTDAYSIKPTKLKISPIVWKYIIRSVLREKNLGFVGHPGCGKTMSSRAAAIALDRPLFMIPMNCASDPRINLLGVTQFINNETKFVYAEFVKAIQTPNAVVVLDELNRSHPDATNILLSALDEAQKYVRIDETEETIKVAPGVSFMATANVGPEFVGTNRLDRALMDRFDWVRIEPLSEEEEYQNLSAMFGARVKEETLRGIAKLADRTRQAIKDERAVLDNILSTRRCEAIASLLLDQFSIYEALEISAYPIFSDAGGNDSSQAMFRKMVQEVFPQETPEGDLLETVDDDDEIKPLFDPSVI